MMLVWPIIWILVMVGLVVATIAAGLREKKNRPKPVQRTDQPLEQEAVAPLDENEGGFGAADGFGDDPFK